MKRIALACALTILVEIGTPSRMTFCATINQVLYERNTFVIGKLTRQFTTSNDSIQRQVFGAIGSGAAYSVDPDVYIGVFADPKWDRFVLMPEGDAYGVSTDFSSPSWVDASPFGRSFIADTGNNRIVIYGGAFGEIPGGNDFSSPSQVLWDDNGTPNDYQDELVWVLDPSEGGIVGYHLVDNVPDTLTSQRYVRLSKTTTPWALLQRPVSMTKRRAYTTPSEQGSYCTTNLIVYDADRDAFIEYNIPRSAGELDPGTLSGVVTVTETPNPVPSTYWRCIVSDAWGNILGIDAASGRIYKFDATFQVVDVYGALGRGPFGTQQMWEPVSLSFVKANGYGGTRYTNNAVLCEAWSDDTGVQRLTMGLSSGSMFWDHVPSSRNVNMGLTLTDHCRASAWIEDIQSGATLRTLAASEVRPAGRNVFAWDGKSAGGADLPPCTSYRLKVKAVGLYASPESVTTSQTFYYKPRIRYDLSLLANQPGSNVTVDGGGLTIGAGGAAVVCSLCTTHMIATPPTQIVNGVRHCFDGWSDNASRIRSVSLTRDSTITLSLTAGPGPTTIASNAAVLDEAFDCKSPYVFQGAASLSNRAGWDSFRVYGNVKFQLPVAQGTETRAHLSLQAPVIMKGAVFETTAPPGTQTPGLWRGLSLGLNGSLDCDSCTIRNAQIGISAHQDFPVKRLTVRRSRFEYNETNDINAAFSGSINLPPQVSITGNVFDNPAAVVLKAVSDVVATGASAVIDGNTFNGLAVSDGGLRLEGGWGGFIRSNFFNAWSGNNAICIKLDRYMKYCGTGCEQGMAWPAPEIHHNTFQIINGPGSTALLAPKTSQGWPIPTTIDATLNTWGTYNSQSDIAQLVQDASDNSGYAVVDYIPWAAPVATSNSFFVPQSGTTTAPVEGTNASRFFRACPNNDGGSSFFSNSRIKIVLKDAGGAPLIGVPATDVFIQLNGGTLAQSFSGQGADSIIANSYWNNNPPCPDLRYLYADAPTDANGVTFITFRGASSSNPGVAVRDPSRKWGHYDSDLPVYAAGFRLDGRLTSGDTNGSYALRIKSMDVVGGLGAAWPADANTGEWVDLGDFNTVANGIGDTGPLSYWKDLDSSGSVDNADFNLVVGHYDHRCSTPLP